LINEWVCIKSHWTISLPVQIQSSQYSPPGQHAYRTAEGDFRL